MIKYADDPFITLSWLKLLIKFEIIRFVERKFGAYVELSEIDL